MRITDLFPGVTTKVLGYLIEHASERLWYHKIASDIDVSTTSVINIITELQRKGIVEVEELGPGRPSLIYLKQKSPAVKALIQFAEQLESVKIQAEAKK